MASRYPGPLRDQPLPIELHNTVYATTRGELSDGIADPAALRAWLAAVASDLPVPAQAVDAERAAQFRALRETVRSALRARRARESRCRPARDGRSTTRPPPAPALGADRRRRHPPRALPRRRS